MYCYFTRRHVVLSERPALCRWAPVNASVSRWRKTSINTTYFSSNWIIHCRTSFLRFIWWFERGLWYLLASRFSSCCLRCTCSESASCYYAVNTWSLTKSQKTERYAKEVWLTKSGTRCCALQRALAQKRPAWSETGTATSAEKIHCGVLKMQQIGYRTDTDGEVSPDGDGGTTATCSSKIGPGQL